MNFSFILPTRGEEDKVRRFLDSLERTTYDKDNIEVLFAIDEGKTDIIEYVNRQNYNFKIKFYERPITDNFSNDYYNWLACRSTGENIWAFNDDAWIRTGHWDRKILDKINHNRWSCYLVDTTDKTRGRINMEFCCFPLISRRSVEEIGFFFYPQVRVYPSDKVIYSLFFRANRIIDAREIVIENTYVSEDSNKRMWDIFQEDLKSGATRVDITKELIILLRISINDKGPKEETKIQKIINIIKEK